jgi:hypothetical protein
VEATRRKVEEGRVRTGKLVSEAAAEMQRTENAGEDWHDVRCGMVGLVIGKEESHGVKMERRREL